jgi:hypothetical protein
VYRNGPGHEVHLFSFRKNKSARSAGLGVTVLFGAILSQNVFAQDIPPPAGAEFTTFAVEELNLEISPDSRSGAVAAGEVTAIRGYPLSQEELSLVLDTSIAGHGFGPLSEGAGLTDKQDKQQPFRTRVVTWIKNRSSDFDLFSRFNADAATPGLHVDVDTDEEELMLQYQVGF